MKTLHYEFAPSKKISKKKLFFKIKVALIFNDPGGHTS